MELYWLIPALRSLTGAPWTGDDLETLSFGRAEFPEQAPDGLQASRSRASVMRSGAAPAAPWLAPRPSRAHAT